MRTLAVVLVLCSGVNALASSLEDKILACGLESGAKVTLGVAIENGKVKSVRPVFKSVREPEVRECVLVATRSHSYERANDRFTVVVSAK